MNSLINLFKSNNRKKIISTLTILLVMIVIILIITHCSFTKKTNTNIADTNDEFYTFTESDLANIVSGIDDIVVLVNSKDIDYMSNVIYNEDNVKSIDVDDSKVDLTRVGEYKIAYKITVFNKKLNKYLDKSIKSNAKETTSININRKVTVVSLEDAQALADNNVAVYTDNNSTVAKSNGSPVITSNESSIDDSSSNKNNSSSSSNSGNSSSNSGGNSSSGGSSTGGGGNSNSSSGSGGSGNNSSSTDTPVKHEHSWTAITNTVHHEATGHYETQVVQAAYDEPIYESRSICNGCGADITSNIEHIFECDPGSYSNKRVQVGTKHHEAVTKQVWVQDSAAWDETVTTGHKCSGCGKTK